MSLVIAERLRPFSHIPGTSTILPGAGCHVQVFPCVLRLYPSEMIAPKEFTFQLTGPIEQFTVCNDLETGRISVWGQAAEGYFRYHVISGNNGKTVRLHVEKAPDCGLLIVQGCKGHTITIQKGQWLDLLEEGTSFEPYQPPRCDRLSLGCNKAQDWELIKRRLSLDEILPLWHRLGQLVKAEIGQECDGGLLSLLERCRDTFVEKKPETAEQHWLNLFRVGFRGLLVPRLEDDDYQGIVQKVSASVSLGAVPPLFLLSEGARLIRELFIQQKKNRVEILPLLFPSLHCGRLIDVRLEGGGVISLEWTKKTIRQMTLNLEEDQEFHFHFRSDVRRYRLRENTKDRGRIVDCKSRLQLRKNCHYRFDNFV